MATITQEPRGGSDTEAQTTRETNTLLLLEGMSCAACALRIEKGLKKLSGVEDAAVNLATEQATVLYRPDETSVEEIRLRSNILPTESLASLSQSYWHSVCSPLSDGVCWERSIRI